METPSILISHPTGNQNVRNSVIALEEHGMLAEFCTTVAWNPSARWNHILPAKLQAQLGRRAYPGVPDGKLRCFPWREMVRLGSRPRIVQEFLSSKERPFSIIGIYRDLDKKVAQRVSELSPDAVYAYEGAALETFREAKKRGIRTIYELSSSYWYWAQKLLVEEAEQNPAFANLLPTLTDSKRHLEWKDEELHLSDVIVVASEHVRATLSGVIPAERIRVINYAAPPIRPRTANLMRADQPLRVLFVGLLAQHKGISYLLDAMDSVRANAGLTLIGSRFRKNRRMDEACKRFQWRESLPHESVLEAMMKADVLVLPSLCDAFGLVVTEALACGLPVIVTTNVGAKDVVRDGVEGYVVPIRDSDAIAGRLELLCRDRELLGCMSRNALSKAMEISWEKYRADWARVVRDAA